MLSQSSRIAALFRKPLWIFALLLLMAVCVSGRAATNAGIESVGTTSATVVAGQDVGLVATVKNLGRYRNFDVRLDVFANGGQQPVAVAVCRTPWLSSSATYRCQRNFKPAAAGTYRVRAQVTNVDGSRVAGSAYYPAEKWSAPLAVLPSTPTSPTAGLPAKVIAAYWTYWHDAPIRIRDIPLAYNVIYLFNAEPVGGAPGTTGEIFFGTRFSDVRGASSTFVQDLAYARTVQKRKIILTVGGANAGMSFPDRFKSQKFVDSVIALHAKLGGFDGIDWNTYEASQAPDTSEMIWISLELKRRIPGFIITTPPAPWRARDMVFCQAMAQAGALDYAAPQYYDGPGLDDPSYVVANVGKWVELLGQSKVVVGFGISDAVNYMSIDEARQTWKSLSVNFPALRGAYNWTVHQDEVTGWSFANQFAPMLGSTP
jgi:hypothetical protein